ncbi:hypothetical protein Tco_1033715 [Tanacetum coccineum]
MVPLRSDTIWLVQNGCFFHGLQFEDPNQHLKDFLELVDSLDLDVTNRERTCLHPQPQALEPSFKAQVQGYMAAHTERIDSKKPFSNKERKSTIGMAEMFGLLKELTASIASEKILVREEARHPITKHVNSISLIRMEEGKVVNKNVVEPNESDIAKPIEVIDRKEETKGGANDETARNAKKGPKEELVEMPRSQPVGYYLKHELKKKLIEGLIGNQRFNDSLLAVQLGKIDNETYDSLPIGPIHKDILKKKITKKEDIGGNFVIPCNIGGLKYMDALID